MSECSWVVNIKQNNSFLRVLLVLRLLSTRWARVGASCSVCHGGNAVTLPDKAITLPSPYSGINTCGQLDAIIPFAGIGVDSDECMAIRSVSSFCGCPIPPNACQLCPLSSSLLGNADQVILFEPIPSDIITPTCALAEAFLHSVQDETDECRDYRALLQNDCLCSGSGGEQQQNATSITDETSNNSIDQAVNADVSYCSGLCPDGSDITFPDKEIGYLLTGLTLPSGVVFDRDSSASPTCDVVETLLRLLVPKDDNACGGAQYLLAGICGCPSSLANPCRFCGDEPLPQPNRMLYSFQNYGFPPAQCEDVRLFLEHVPDDDDGVCEGAIENNFLCGCGTGYNSDFRNEIQWIPRCTGCLSFLGSSFIIFSVWQKYRKGKLNLYHQVIGAISFCDLICSLTFLLYPILLPEYNEFGESNGVRGAYGNEATCKLSGFMLQLGVTGVIYQISLSSYFLFVIYYGWQETKINRYTCFFHIPLLIGLGLAFAGLPFYENMIFLCYIPRGDQSGSYAEILIFLFIPLSLSVLITSVNMTAVYLKVRRQFAESRRWRISQRALMTQTESTRSAQWGRGRIVESIKKGFRNIKKKATEPPQARVCLEREMFWQCLLYLGVFYLTWSFLLVSQLGRFIHNQPLWVCVWLVAPSQGFFNFLVYIRPTAARNYREWRHRRYTESRSRNASRDTDPSLQASSPHRKHAHSSPNVSDTHNATITERGIDLADGDCEGRDPEGLTPVEEGKDAS